MRLSNAYSEGKKAALEGKPITDCPYQDGSDREFWMRGYLMTKISGRKV